MQPTTRLWTGPIFSALAVLFMLFDTIGHLLRIQPVVDAFAHLGYPLSRSVGLGVVELVCTLAYVFQPTSILGAILLTGYLLSTTLFPLYIAALVWGGLWLRDEQLRGLIPLRRS